MNKMCTKCGDIKQLADFRKYKSGSLVGKCRECERAVNRAWRTNNPGRAAELYARWIDSDPRWYVFVQRRSDAKRKGIPFTITMADIIWPTHCPALGVELDYRRTTGKRDLVPSIDRKDSTLGYIPGNVGVLSWKANRIKNDATAAEVKAVADWMGK